MVRFLDPEIVEKVDKSYIDIADMDKCGQDICCLDKCHCDSWNQNRVGNN